MEELNGNAEVRADLSKGASLEDIYKMVMALITEKNISGGIIADIGCGEGRLWKYLNSRFYKYVGLDIKRYVHLPEDVEFLKTNLDRDGIPLEDNSCDVVCGVEIIEHLENPRGFVRETARVLKPGGTLLITTPNQLSILSIMTLIVKKQFNAFQEVQGSKSPHITALLEADLVRIFTESGLKNIEVRYSNSGRMPFTSMHWPEIPLFSGRAFSDNILCVGTKKG